MLNITRACLVKVVVGARSAPTVVNLLKKGSPVAAHLYTPEVDFAAKKGEVFCHRKTDADRTILVGLGEAPCLADVADGVFHAVTAAKKLKQQNIDLMLPEIEGLQAAEIATTLASTVVLSDYAFDKFLTKNKQTKLDSVTIVPSDHTVVPLPSVEQAVLTAECVTAARDLANTRADTAIPSYVQQYAESICKEYPETVSLRTLFVGEELRQNGLNLLHAVGQGAVDPPRLVVLQYTPRDSSPDAPLVAVVGKGITFDSGGLHLKPTAGMLGMHLDMHGAATTLGLLRAAAATDVRVPIIAAVALAENAVGPRSYRPNTILQSLKGLSVEVLNTDAEGRLALADTLTYVQREHKPQILIDFATLTGAIIAALGENICGFFANDDNLSHLITQAGERALEPVWRMPIVEQYSAALKGTHSDLVNWSPSAKGAGSGIAAAFLQNFIEPNTKWAHFDIAGVAMLSKAHTFRPQGATGFGVKLGLELLHKLAK